MTNVYKLTVLGVPDGDPVICIDCECGVTICEASPATIEHDPAWLTRNLVEHTALHEAWASRLVEAMHESAEMLRTIMHEGAS